MRASLAERCCSFTISRHAPLPVSRDFFLSLVASVSQTEEESDTRGPTSRSRVHGASRRTAEVHLARVHGAGRGPERESVQITAEGKQRSVRVRV